MEMESHKGKYEITQNPEVLNDTSLCKFKFNEGKNEDETVSAKYEYEFVDVPQSVAEQEFSDEVGEEFEKFIGEILIEYLSEQMKAEQEYKDDEGRTVRKYNFTESSDK